MSGACASSRRLRRAAWLPGPRWRRSRRVLGGALGAFGLALMVTGVGASAQHRPGAGTPRSGVGIELRSHPSVPGRLPERSGIAASEHPLEGDLRDRQERLERFGERRRLEAGVEIRRSRRARERRFDALHLREDASPEEVERAARRWERREAEDALRTQVDLRALERRTGWPMGPVTRRILSSRLRPARTRDRRAREAEAEAQREAAEARRARGDERGFLELPPRVPEPPR